MERSLTFFRAFDLAFFAPGTALLAATAYLMFPAAFSGQSDLGTTEAVIGVIAFIAATFVTGLVLHSFVWLIRKLLIKPITKRSQDASKSPRSSLLLKLLKDGARADLLLYFWYLRATCWNLALVVLIVTPLAWCAHERVPLPKVAIVLLGLLLFVVLACQGSDFDRCLQAEKREHECREKKSQNEDSRIS